MRYLYLLAFISSLTFAQAQRVVVRKGSSSYTPPPVEGRLLVGIDPVALLVGYVPVEAEYRIADWFTAGLGVGYVTKNYFRIAIDEPGNFYQNGGGGFGFNLSTRFFTGADAFDDGWYMGLMYRNLRFNGSLSEVAIYNPATGQDEFFQNVGFRRSYQDYTIIFGRQYNVGRKMILDFFVGIGYAGLDFTYDQPDVEDYRNNYPEEDFSRVSLPIGFKVSYLIF